MESIKDYVDRSLILYEADAVVYEFKDDLKKIRRTYELGDNYSN